MSRTTTLLASLTILLMAVMFAGCTDGGDSTPADSSDDHSDAGADDARADDEATDDSDKEEFLGGLSPEDREAVEKQRTCPVSGDLLWDMAAPRKVTVTDSQGTEHVVFLCCKSCERKLKANVDEFVKKLNK